MMLSKEDSTWFHAQKQKMRELMEWEDKKVIITGIGGFIGYNLAKSLLHKKAHIIGIDNFSYVKKEWFSDIIDKIKLIEADVSQKETFKKIESDIDYIFHFAAPSSIVLFDKNPEKCYLETILGQWNVLRFAKKNNVKKLVYPTSGSIYGGNKKPHKEDIYPKPRNLYGSAKMTCEAIASNYEPSVKSTGLRIFAGYGNGEERKGEFASVIYLFINDIMNNRSPVIYGDGSQARDFIFIEDIIESIIRSAEIEFSGIINVGTGNSISFSELVGLIKQELGKNIEPKYIPKPKIYVETLTADTTLMRKTIGINSMPIEMGIRKFITYLKEIKPPGEAYGKY